MRFFNGGLANESPERALSTESVFEVARLEGRIMELDFYCRQQAMAEIAEQSFAGLLFLNINPASLLNERHSVGRTDDLAERCEPAPVLPAAVLDVDGQYVDGFDVVEREGVDPASEGDGHLPEQGGLPAAFGAGDDGAVAALE